MWRVSRSASWIIVTSAAFLLAIAAVGVIWQGIMAVTSALSLGDYLAVAKALGIYAIFTWVLLCGTISLISEIGAVRRFVRCEQDVVPPDYRSFYKREAESELLVLIPSFREEGETIWQTLMSGALAEHPRRHVVLLIDDPEPASTPENALLLASARGLPGQLQDLFDQAAAPFEQEYRNFVGRRVACLSVDTERSHLARLYEEAANWLDQERRLFLARRAGRLAHTDQLFADRVLQVPAAQHRSYAIQLQSSCLTSDDIETEYERLASLFRVRFSSFERKQYANFSHAPNKAMNLNSYLSLIDGAYQEVASASGKMLLRCSQDNATLVIPSYHFVVTIDADSLITHDFNVHLLEIMNRPGHERIAVAQSPYTAVPGAPNAIERTAAASTDAQFFSHQGLAYWGAASWVGASALIRYEALRDIATTRIEQGHRIEIFIKDDILIEDAAATIDLLRKGWQIHHDHRRLSYSSTPPDFGSLIIQRRRWANGGLLIMPRLLTHTLRWPWSLHAWTDAVMRIPGLTSAATNGAFFSAFMIIPFDNALVLSMIVAMLPSMLLTSVGLVRAGYLATDIIKVQALSVLLVPVNLSGTLRSLQQALTGRQVPFARTPKISGRTPTPRRYVFAIYFFMTSALCATAVYTELERYSQAALVATNDCILFFCLIWFLGFRNSLEDLGLKNLARLRLTDFRPTQARPSSQDFRAQSGSR